MLSPCIQLNMLEMTRRRKPSTPSAYRREFIARTRAARAMSGKSQQQIADALGVKLNTYQTREMRYLLPHHQIIPFCEATGVDHFFLLTGRPFTLGRIPGPQLRPDA